TIQHATRRSLTVFGAMVLLTISVAAQNKVRIVQTNSAGDNVHVIDHATNNIAIARDGRRVYVGIIQEPGGVDVIDTGSLKNVKTIPTRGTIHNPYVTPDGKYVVAGSIQGKTVNVIDAQTETPAWTVDMDLGVRPMAFARNADGSTK